MEQTAIDRFLRILIDEEINCSEIELTNFKNESFLITFRLVLHIDDKNKCSFTERMTAQKVGQFIMYPHYRQTIIKEWLERLQHIKELVLEDDDE